MKIKNTSNSTRRIPSVGLKVAPGEVVEVSAAVGADLTKTGLFKEVKAEAKGKKVRSEK